MRGNGSQYLKIKSFDKQQKQSKKNNFAFFKLAYVLTLSPYNFETEAQEPKPISFSSVRKDFVGTSPKKNSCWQFSGAERFTKKNHFFPPISV